MRRRAVSRCVVTAELPQGQAKVHAVRSMFDTIAPRYELVNRFISLGLDRHWRKVAMKQLDLPAGSVVIDIAAGTGDFCRLLEDQSMYAIGVDLSLGMLVAAHTTSPLLQADALQLPFPDGSVDGVTCGFALRNFVALPPFFEEIARVVKPGGRIALLDAAQPTLPVVKQLHSLYFGKVMPRIGGLFSDKSAYQYLPKSLAYLPSPDVLQAQLSAAGFSSVQRKSLTFGAAQLITATR